MKKSSLIILIIVLIICSITSCVSGIVATAIIYTANPKIETKIENNTVYFESTASYQSLSYVPNNISEVEKRELLDSFSSHFTFAYDTENNTEYQRYFENYGELLKLNMENSRRALTEIFQAVPEKKIEIIAIDTVAKYEKYAGLDWDDTTTYSGLATYTNKIYLLMKKGLILENEELIDLMSHELVHIFQYNAEPTYAYSDYPPNWFVEGMADTMKTGKHSYVKFPRNTFPKSLDDLDDSFAANSSDLVELNIAYDISTMFYQHLEAKYTRKAMISILADIDNRSFGDSFKNNTGVEAKDAYLNWLAEK